MTPGLHDMQRRQVNRFLFPLAALAAADVIHDQHAASNDDEVKLVSVSGGFNCAAFDDVELASRIDWISPDGDDPCAGFPVGIMATLR
jgi:hypothetical protein